MEKSANKCSLTRVRALSSPLLTLDREVGGAAGDTDLAAEGAAGGLPP